MDTQLLEILKSSPKFTQFVERHPYYDTVIRILTEQEIDGIRNEYPNLHIFQDTVDEIIAVTIVSRILMENGYPKIKAYLDRKNKRIVHFFVSD